MGGRNANGEFADTRTPAQKQALLLVLAHLKLQYPNAQIVGHRELNKGKVCPCFDATVYNSLLEKVTHTLELIQAPAIEPGCLP